MAKRGTYDRHIKVGVFQEIVQKEIEGYVRDLQESIPDIVEQAGKKCVQGIRAHAVMAGIPDREYAKSWKVKIIDKNAWGTFLKVYSPKKYRIAHLLEHGHTLKVHGKVVGTVRAYPHLVYAEKEAILFLENKMKKTIEEG